MIPFHKRFVTDEEGQRTAILLDIAEYNRLLEELEELESIRACDVAKSSGDEAIPFEQAVAEMIPLETTLPNVVAQKGSSAS